MLFHVIAYNKVFRAKENKTFLKLLVMGPNLIWMFFAFFFFFRGHVAKGYSAIFVACGIILLIVIFNIFAYFGCLYRTWQMRSLATVKGSKEFAIVRLVDRYKWYPII